MVKSLNSIPTAEMPRPRARLPRSVAIPWTSSLWNSFTSSSVSNSVSNWSFTCCSIRSTRLGRSSMKSDTWVNRA
jgi:hypothetical protein